MTASLPMPNPIPTTAPVPQLSAASLLHLIWLASPALPIGGFSYSEGLEAGVLYAGVATESVASDWLSDQLMLTLVRGDLAIVAQALSAWRTADWPRIAQLNAWVLQTRETSEMRLQTEQMGRSLCAWLRNHPGSPAEADPAELPRCVAYCAQLPPTYPVAFALAAAQTDAPAHACLLAFAFGWAENMTQTAIKAVPLGQSAGQRILARLSRDIPTAVDLALALPSDERQAFSPLLAILSSQHETQYSRLFRS